MRSIQFSGTDITASRLGFGCSALFDASADPGLRLLEVAYDEGITYFDAARMYGDGAAELILGKFVRGKRDRVVIASKFGIQPVASMLAHHGRVRGLIAKLIRLSPRLRDLLRRQIISTGRFNVNDARKSLEVSLRTLGTDYLDIYLLHDCSASDPSEELLHFLERSRGEGKIRYFGLASKIDAIAGIVRNLPEFGRVAQFENSVLKRNLERAGDLCGAVITHGAMAASLAALRRSLDHNPQLLLQWSARLQVDLAQTGELANLMLAWAVRANTRGPVLFHSSREDSIRRNLAAVENRRFSPAQIDEFDRLTVAQRTFTPVSDRSFGAAAS
jgi:D-threo-aldose 1-dehydrogenase